MGLIVFLVGEVEYIRLPAGIDALIELDNLLRPMLPETSNLRPLSGLLSETEALGDNIELSVFRLWLRKFAALEISSILRTLV